MTEAEPQGYGPGHEFRVGDVVRIEPSVTSVWCDPQPTLATVVGVTRYGDIGSPDLLACQDANGGGWTVSPSRLTLVCRTLAVTAPPGHTAVLGPVVPISALEGDYPRATPSTLNTVPLTAGHRITDPRTPEEVEWDLREESRIIGQVLADAMERTVREWARTVPPPTTPPPYTPEAWQDRLLAVVRHEVTPAEIQQDVRDGRAPSLRASMEARSLNGPSGRWFQGLPLEDGYDLCGLDYTLPREQADRDRLGAGCGGGGAVPHTVRRDNGVCSACYFVPRCYWCSASHDQRRLRDMNDGTAHFSPGSVRCADANACPGIPF